MSWQIRWGWKSPSVVEALSAAAPALSLTGSDEEGAPQIDLPVESPEEELADSISLRQVLALLEEKDQMLIRLRYFKGKTQVETAAVLGMTQVQVSRREKKILLHLPGIAVIAIRFAEFLVKSDALTFFSEIVILAVNREKVMDNGRTFGRNSKRMRAVYGSGNPCGLYSGTGKSRSTQLGYLHGIQRWKDQPCR